MSDVFVSYKAEDRKRVRPLVEALQADGYSVWWDEQIGGGAAWRDTIQEQLDAAKCVIVIWSKRSVGADGRFVRDEAGRAQRRGAYLPVRIDAVEPPLGFGETQALQLRNWHGDRADRRYQAVEGAVQSMIAGDAPHMRAPAGRDRGVDRRVVLGGAIGAVAVAGAGAWLLLKPGSAEAAGSIAVLPFENLSGDPNQAYFSDGLAEELRSALARTGLQVVGRTSSEAVKNADAKTAAKKLGVANILTGSVRRSPNTIRVSAQLVKGSDGLERWSQDYDRKPGDALKIQSDIAQNVANALSVTLGRAAKGALNVGGTTSAEAQDLYLQAEAVLGVDNSEDGYRRAIRLFDSAIALDPKFAEAYAHKSFAINFMTGETGSAATFEAGYAQAANAAKQAIAIAPGLSVGHFALATALEFQLNLPGALEEFRRAEALLDKDVSGQLQYVFFLARLGAWKPAVELARQAQKRDPLNSAAFHREAFALAYSHHYAEAIPPLQKAIRLTPTISRGHSLLGLCLLQLGRIDEAQAEYANASPDDLHRIAGQAIAFWRQNNRAASEQELKRGQQRFGEQGSYQYAEVYAQRGDKDRALAALDRAWAIRDPGLATLKVDPFLDPLRSDPRFAALEKKLDFPAVSAA